MHPFKIHGDLVEWSPTGYMTIIGVDPGLSGAVAILTHVTDHDKLTEGNNSLDIFDMPVHHLKRGGKNKREIDRYQLARLVEKCCPIDKAIVERVGAMPGQGVSSMFQFGRAVGIIEGILAAMYIPTEYVAPRTWRSYFKVRAGKDSSRERASALMPRSSELWARKKDTGRADAALIALYGVRAD